MNLLLTHFDLTKEVMVTAGVSMIRLSSGEIKAIAHGSRSLASAKADRQIKEQALELVYGVTRFHKMLHGQTLIFQMDHQPLFRNFDTKRVFQWYTAQDTTKPINRLQRALGPRFAPVRCPPNVNRRKITCSQQCTWKRHDKGCSMRNTDSTELVWALPATPIPTSPRHRPSCKQPFGKFW